MRTTKNNTRLERLNININNLNIRVRIAEMKRNWRDSFTRNTGKAILEVFPEVKKIIQENIKLLETKQQNLIKQIESSLVLIRGSNFDEFSDWFCKEWIKTTLGKELLEIEEKISKLKYLLLPTFKNDDKKWISEKQIEQALDVPIEDVFEGSLKNSGKLWIGICPFHNDKHPSFYIYPETNSFYCFGCNQGGNAINFIRLLHGYNFKEAVQYLTRK